MSLPLQAVGDDATDQNFRQLAASIPGSEVVLATSLGFVGNGTTSNDAAFERAAESFENSGKTLYFPNGVYRITKPVPEINGFRIRGAGGYDWDQITRWGTVFALEGELTSTASNVFTLHMGSAIEGCVFYYPGESAANATPAITATGYVIKLTSGGGREGGEALNNVLVNCPFGISNNHAWSRVNGNRICPTNTAIQDEEQFVEHQMSENEISPGVWKPAYSGAIMPYIAQNAVGFKLTKTLGTFTGNSIFGLKDGYRFEGPIGFTSITGGLVDGCRYCLRFKDECKGDVIVSNVTFGSTVSATIGATRDKYATLESNCVKVERPSAALSLTLSGCKGDGANGDLIDVVNGSGSSAPVHLTVEGGHWENEGRFAHTYTMPVTEVSGTFTESLTANDGDKITGGTSGATAIIRKLESGTLYLDSVVGSFSAAEKITGSKSGATAKVTSIAEGPRLQFIRYEDAQNGDLIVNGVKVDLTAYLWGAGIWAVDGGMVTVIGNQFRSVRASTSYSLQANAGVSRVMESANTSEIPVGIKDTIYAVGPTVASGTSNWSRP